MRRSLKLTLTVLMGLFLAWGAVGWYLAKDSKQTFDVALAAIASGSATKFFELEVLSYEETFFGASAELKLIPSSGLIAERVENQVFHLSRTNGPLFINRQGLQFGIARWQLSLAQSVNDDADTSFWGDLLSSDQAMGSLVLNFSETASVSVKASSLSWSNWLIDSIAVEGDIDFSDHQHELEIRTTGVVYAGKQFSLRFPKASLFSNNSVSSESSSESPKKLTKLSFVADDGELILARQLKKIPLVVQSHGSIWVNNDTLSGDWQINADGGKFGNAGDPEKNDSFRTQLTLQFRELLTSGFWQYLTSQSEISSLLQQAEWAVEEVETPEQQDFLRALYVDADRIKQSRLDNPLKPMLVAERSQLAANITHRVGVEDEASQLSLSGSAKSKANEPVLALKGEAKIIRRMLSEQLLALFAQWNKRGMFRRYEAEFESDVALRNERFLLNNIVVSVDGLAAELSRALADQ